MRVVVGGAFFCLLFFAELLLNLATRKKVHLSFCWISFGETCLRFQQKSWTEQPTYYFYLPQIMEVESGCISNIRSWRWTWKWLWTTCGCVQTYISGFLGQLLLREKRSTHLTSGHSTWGMQSASAPLVHKWFFEGNGHLWIDILIKKLLHLPWIDYFAGVCFFGFLRDSPCHERGWLGFFFGLPNYRGPKPPSYHQLKQLENFCYSQNQQKMQPPSHLALPAFTIHLKASVETWFGSIGNVARLGGSVIFLVFFQVF